MKRLAVALLLSAPGSPAAAQVRTAPVETGAPFPAAFGAVSPAAASDLIYILAPLRGPILFWSRELQTFKADALSELRPARREAYAAALEVLTADSPASLERLGASGASPRAVAQLSSLRQGLRQAASKDSRLAAEVRSIRSALFGPEAEEPSAASPALGPAPSRLQAAVNETVLAAFSSPRPEEAPSRTIAAAGAEETGRELSRRFVSGPPSVGKYEREMERRAFSAWVRRVEKEEGGAWKGELVALARTVRKRPDLARSSPAAVAVLTAGIQSVRRALAFEGPGAEELHRAAIGIFRPLVRALASQPWFSKNVEAQLQPDLAALAAEDRLQPASREAALRLYARIVPRPLSKQADLGEPGPWLSLLVGGLSLGTFVSLVHAGLAAGVTPVLLWSVASALCALGLAGVVFFLPRKPAPQEEEPDLDYAAAYAELEREMPIDRDDAEPAERFRVLEEEEPEADESSPDLTERRSRRTL